MGRLGPLTSQALGRSPYDDVVPGEGEAPPAAPRQEYDERGRPVCPETKRINKDVIRSHNEVMQVIGVAEPEDGMSEAQHESALRHMQYEERISRVCCNVGRTLEIVGLWGVNGTRQRILLYRQYANIPFYDLFHFEREQRPISSSLLAGLPSFVANQALRHLLPGPLTSKKSKWAAPVSHVIAYFRMHLEIFVFMQRMGIISATIWLPSPLFFIPCSAVSPIPPPPRLSSPTWEGILQCAGEFALGATPFALFYLYTRTWGFLTRFIWTEIFQRLPKPHNASPLLNLRLLPRVQDRNPATSETQPAVTENATVADEAGASELAAAATQQDDQTIRALEGQEQQPPVGALRRQSTFSARGDDYASDEEETEVVSATLISFDVEQTDSADTPPGIWAAELRPNVADPRNAGQLRDGAPLYRENSLTNLPAILATDVLALIPARILVAPVEALALRALAQAFLARSGSSSAGIYSINPFSDLSFGAVANLVALEAVHLFIQGDIWAFMTMVVQSFRMTEEEWNELDSMDPNGES